MKIGIVGLPNTGKTTLFNALTGSGAIAADYPYSTIEPNIATVDVPDPRLDFLAQLYSPKKITPATIEFVDIAGLPRGASKGEGLGNRFLSYIREVDAVLHVVRCFENTEQIPCDPLGDIEIVEMELILADIEIVERRYLKQEKVSKTDRSLIPEVNFLARLLQLLADGKTARELTVVSEMEAAILKEMPLLSTKPIIYVANISDDIYWNGEPGEGVYVKQIERYAASQKAEVIEISALVEQEFVQLGETEREEFLKEIGRQRGLDRLIRQSYGLLKLISFLTAGSPEVRAWTITEGTKAREAAGKIHSDLARGFIRAEIVAFEHLKECGNMAAAKEKGLVRIEGRDYIMKDGDVTLIRFNV
ncbi:MAG: redox-regulated ATPase YchF [Oscillospiraceae bacterium]|nr:redox-regulated ATPase YchF [Oscillospiraceae bacterium]